jgi:hypothetical protein
MQISKLRRLAEVEFWIARRYFVMALIFFLLVLGRFHGSSIGMWDTKLLEKTDKYKQVNVLGKPRAIRSDEWTLGTLWYLAQSMSDDYYPLINKNIRSDGQNMLLVAYAPVFDVSIIGKPANWGFLLFGREYGFSWWWFSRLFFLLLSSFELAMILSRENKLFSCVCALWIAFAPAVQWWYASVLVDILYYTQFLVVAIYKYLATPVKKHRALLAVAISICSIGFCLSTYPRYQVPMAYLIMCFAACFIYEKRADLRLFGRAEFLQIALSGLAAAGIVYSVFIRSMDAIRLFSDTSYPGKQFFTGGTGHFFYSTWYLTNWLLPYKENINFYNDCVVSTFFNFLPALLSVILMMIAGLYKVDKSRKTLIFVLFLYALFQTSWELVSYPGWFAKYSLFFCVKSTHLFLLSTNLLGVYISILVFSLLIEKPPFAARGALIISSMVSVFYYIAIQNTRMKLYMTPTQIGIVLTFMFALNYSYIKAAKKYLYTLLLILILVSGVTVNPLARGLSPIYDKAVSQEVLRIHAQYPDAKWAFVGGMFRANLFPALGVKSFNGYHLYPDLKMWRLLDPEGVYISQYNRFSDVVLRFTEKKTYFTIPPDALDVLNVFLNWSDLNRTGIRFIVSSEPIDNVRYLRKLSAFEKDYSYFYEVVSQEPFREMDSRGP